MPSGQVSYLTSLNKVIMKSPPVAILARMLGMRCATSSVSSRPCCAAYALGSAVNKANRQGTCIVPELATLGSQESNVGKQG